MRWLDAASASALIAKTFAHTLKLTRRFPMWVTFVTTLAVVVWSAKV
jgi:hypothetical protein